MVLAFIPWCLFCDGRSFSNDDKTEDDVENEVGT
jgi:hypothetical protein